jgi:hypothetical protein
MALGCLPKYDNLAGGSGGSGGGDAAVDAPANQLSPWQVKGRVIVFDNGVFADGLTAYIDGFPQIRSGPTVNGGFFQVPIPQAACGTPHYLVFEGQVNSLPLLRSYVAPMLALACTADETITLAHVFLDDPGATAVRTTLAQELEAHGDIPDAASTGAAFGATSNWAWTGMFTVRDEVFYSFTGGTISVVSPPTGCRSYYLNTYSAYQRGTVASLINFAATTAPTQDSVVVCSSTQTGNITLRAQGYTVVPAGTPAQFPDIQVPMVPQGAAFGEWHPSSF